jgi:cbb3-type cytochrome oxidase subunit 1
LSFIIGVVLLVRRPEILATYHYNQYVVAVTHLVVLGWILTVVIGAMYQLVPVALETRLYSERLANWQLVFHVAGFAGMVWMFWTWNMKHVGHFGTVLALGVGMFVWNIARTLCRVPRWSVVATAIVSSLAWLCATVLAGLSIAATKAVYAMDPDQAAPGYSLALLLSALKALARFVGHFDQIAAMHAHAHIGILGVFVLLIVGISYKLVPMFTLSELQNPFRAWLSIALLNVGLVGCFITILLRSGLKLAFGLVVAAGLVAYALEIFAILRVRKRRSMDWGIMYFLSAVGVLFLLASLGLVLAWRGLPVNTVTGQLENLYGFLVLVGAVSFAIVGMLYKIVPFLVWYGAYSPLIGVTKVPALADLYCARLQAVGYWSYLAGVAVAGVGIVSSHAGIVRAGCAVLLMSLAALAVNLLKILSHLVRPRVTREIASPSISPAFAKSIPSNTRSASMLLS